MILIENLSKEFDVPGGQGSSGPTVAADNLNMEIPQGEIYGVVGPNGAGKTTTLKMVCGLLVPTSGRILVNGIDVEKQPEEAQRHLGYLADFFTLYDDLKVWEYLDYFARAYKLPPSSIPARVEHLLVLLGLSTKRDAFIEGLSRGMKQRLGIARAIVHDPPVLILDEPTAGLDPQARLDFKKLVKDLNQAGKTILVTSHLLADLQQICSSLAILEKGRLLRSGKLDEILKQPETPGSAPAARETVRIRLAVPGFDLVEWLARQPHVSGATKEDSGAQFEFAGAESDLAKLVQDLVAAGAPVCGVEQVTKSLEEVYSKITRGEVM